MAKRSKRRGSSKAGRKRIAGERYANGRLKPRGPNATVIAKRKAGDAEAGEHPLDFALSQKWITERQHRDAMAYRNIYQGAHIGGPRLSSGSLVEVPPKESVTMSWSQMSDEEVSEIWNTVFSDDYDPQRNSEEAHGQALAQWRVLNAHLSPGERQQLFLVSVMGSWPFWMTKAAADQALGAQDVDRREALFGAIHGVGRALRPPKAPEIISAPHKPVLKPGTEVPVHYENQHGEPIEPRSKRGRPFEVAVVQRRR